MLPSVVLTMLTIRQHQYSLSDWAIWIWNYTTVGLRLVILIQSRLWALIHKSNHAHLFHMAFKLSFKFTSKTREAILEMLVTWDQMHLMITKSTTPDLILLYYKLIDYFRKQFTESKDYLKEFTNLDLFYEMRVKQQCKSFLNLWFARLRFWVGTKLIIFCFPSWTSHWNERRSVKEEFQR